jgi:Na+/H+ antiporter NhaC
VKKVLNYHIIFLLFLLLPTFNTFSQTNGTFSVKLPDIIVQHVKQDVRIALEQDTLSSFSGKLSFKINNEVKELPFEDGRSVIEKKFTGKETLSITYAGETEDIPVNPIPLWMSILPPLIAILIALIFREVFSALFIGILIGGSIISYYQGAGLFVAFFKGLFLIADTYIIESLADTDHLSIIVFSMMIGAMVSLITRNGGMKGVVNYLSKYASSPGSGQFVTWLLGIMIFFDDYANTLVVGNTMRPVADRLKVSREKLAYIVDSTAAPVASIAFVTTWIGAELSYIQDGINVIGLEESAYGIFLNSLMYSFYPVFALALILILIFRKVDYGPMLKAEQTVRRIGVAEIHLNTSGKSNEMEAVENVPARWYNAVIPVFIVIAGTFAGLIYTGWDPAVWADDSLRFTGKLSQTIGNSDSYKALLWSSLGGVLAAVLLTVSQRLLNLRDSIEGLMIGFRTMLTAILILTLAWSIALITEHMHTAEFISRAMLNLSISPYIVPAITFILAALVAFSTGSSWGTMAILYPLLLPSAWLITAESGFNYEASMSIFYNVVSGVLAGSVLGDHCSPISDTTILSSLASSCNHIEHVRTQLPYALTAGIVAIFIGTLPAAYGIHPGFLFPAGIGMLLLISYVFGRKAGG